MPAENLNSKNNLILYQLNYFFLAFYKIQLILEEILVVLSLVL